MSAESGRFPVPLWSIDEAAVPSESADPLGQGRPLRSGRRERTARVILNGGTIVLPDQLIMDGSVVLEDGRVAGVFRQAHGRSGTRGELYINAYGKLVLPGFIDLHNDNLEAEISPRPRASLPVPLALATLDRRLVASGVTTECDAIFFADMTRNERRLDEAPRRAAAVFDHSAGPHALLDHHVLFRVDLWSPDSLELALEASATARVPLLSLNDHTPGQGQYRDVEQFKHYYREVLGRDENEVEREVEEQTARAREQADVATHVLDRVRSAAEQRNLILMSHDDDTPERVELMYAVGARIGEFPVTLEAARRQRELGMAITAGAPNIVRRGSASGNISALDLVANGLVDVLCADYHVPSLLTAVLQLAESGMMTLAEAVRLVTLNPARALRLESTIGSLEAGKQADVVVIDVNGPAPVVELAFNRGDLVYYAPARRHARDAVCGAVADAIPRAT